MIENLQVRYNEALDRLMAGVGSGGQLVTGSHDGTPCTEAHASIVAGLAGLLTRKAALVLAMRNTLLNMASHQTPAGHLPAKVLLPPQGKEEPHYGRYDSLSWFIIGACNYYQLTNDIALFDELRPAIDKALQTLDAADHQQKELLYIPQGANWAHTYPLPGYTLYDQALRLWALRAYNGITESKQLRLQIEYLDELLRVNFWPGQEHVESKLVYEPAAYRQYIDKAQATHYWLPAFGPDGYATRFDALGNALCLLTKVGAYLHTRQVLAFTEQLRQAQPTQLVPQFWPPINKYEHGWEALQLHEVQPGQAAPANGYNGGSWPWVNALMGIAMQQQGNTQHATEVLVAIHRANSQGYPDYLHTQNETPGGQGTGTLSAAAAVLLQHQLNGEALYFG